MEELPHVLSRLLMTFRAHFVFAPPSNGISPDVTMRKVTASRMSLELVFTISRSFLFQHVALGRCSLKSDRQRERERERANDSWHRSRGRGEGDGSRGKTNDPMRP